MAENKQKSSKNELSGNDDFVLEPTESETGEENLLKKLKDLKDKLELCLKEKAEYLAGWQRAKADYVNLKKESENEASRGSKAAAVRILSDIIPILDSFDLAMGNAVAWETVSKEWRTGVEYIAEQLRGALQKNGLEEICPKEKDDVEFDSHAVVETVETDDKSLDGKIFSVLQKGYKIDGKILRPARVKVFISKSNK